MIHTIEELKSELKSKNFSVEWKVHCEIGPDWIGGGRNVCFYLDNQPLGETEFHSMLINQLVSKINIPSSSEEHVIEGEGELNIINSELVVKYTITSNIPYDMAFNYESGEVALVSGI